MHGVVIAVTMGLTVGPPGLSDHGLSENTAHRKAERVMSHLRYVVDDVPATTTIGPCDNSSRGWWCPYALTFQDGERFSSALLLKRHRGYIGWRLLHELPVRFSDDPITVSP